MILEVEIAGAKRRVEITHAGGRLLLKIGDGAEEQIDAVFPEPGVIQFLRGGKSYEFRLESTPEPDIISLDRRGRKLAVKVLDPRSLRSRRSPADEAGPKKITAPMPGKVVRILLAAGAIVEAGDGVIVIEAMKMQNELKSPKSGTVQKLLFAEGDTVNPGDTLAIIE